VTRILVGTASWSDPGFVEYWYPKKMPAGDRLAWYAEHFDMVELNSSFYSVPDPEMARRWCESTPGKFVFNVKLHQLLSHHSTPVKFLPPAIIKRLHLDKSTKVTRTAEVEREMISAFTPALEVFQRADKLGVLLLQLSPAFSPRKHELNELKHVLELTRKFRVAVELRNRNWAEGEQLARTVQFLREWNAIFVNIDGPREGHFTIMPSDIDAITNPDVAYLRLHGRNAKGYLTGKTVAARFNYNYSDAEIADVAERTQKLARKAKEVHIVFNNNARDYAPHAALRLRKALGQVVASPPQTGELF
jgi:uncharacterized protein YecE (DUF72 family)